MIQILCVQFIVTSAGLLVVCFVIVLGVKLVWSRVVKGLKGDILCCFVIFVWGHALAQLVEALRYKPEGRGFDSRWFHRNLSMTYCFQPHNGPGVDLVSNRNEYQE